jgi:chromosome segregation protein
MAKQKTEQKVLHKEPSDEGAVVERLKDEKEMLTQKYKSLADIIEKLSTEKSAPSPAPNQQGHVKDLEERFNFQLGELKENLRTLEKRIIKDVKSSIDPNFVEKFQSLDKLNGYEQKLQELSKRFDEIGKESTEIDEKIERLKLELRNFVQDIGNSLTANISSLEQRTAIIERGFRPETAQKLSDLIYSADEMIHHTIPNEVREKIQNRIGPLTQDVINLKENSRNLENKLNDAVKHLNQFKDGLRFIDAMKDDVSRLRKERELLYEKVVKKEKKLLEMFDEFDELQNKDIKKVQERIEKVEEILKSYPPIIENSVKKLFDQMIQSKFEKLDKNFSENMDKVENRIKDLAVDYHKVEGKIIGMDNALETMGKDLQKLTTQTVQLTRTDFLDDGDRKAIEARIEAFKDRMDENKKNFEKSLAEIKNIVGDLEIHENEIKEKLVAEVKGTTAEVGVKIAELEHDIESLKGGADNAEKKFIEVLKDTQSLKNYFESKFSDLDKFLQKNVRDFDKAFSDIKSSNNDYKQKIDIKVSGLEGSLNQRLLLIDRTLESLKNEKEDADKKIKNNIANFENLLKKKDFFEDKIKLRLQTIESNMDSKTSQIQKNLEKINKVGEVFESRRDFLERTLKNINDDRENVLKRIRDLEVTSADNEHTLEKKVRNIFIDMVNPKLAEFEKKIANSIEFIDAKAKESDKNFQHFNKSIESLNSNIESIHREIERFNMRISQLSQSKFLDEDDLKIIDERIKNVKQQTDTKYDERTERLDTEIKMLMAEIDKLEKIKLENKMFSDSIVDIKRSTSDLAEKMSRIDRVTSMMDDKISDLEKEVKLKERLNQRISNF